MGRVSTGLSISLDGFIAGPNDGPERPLGEGGERLFAWYSGGDTEYRLPGADMVFEVSPQSAELLRGAHSKMGVFVTGRRTFDVANGWAADPPWAYRDALLLGRVTYEGFAAAWPQLTEQAGEYAAMMNGCPKYVVSTTLEEPLEWNNSTLVKGYVAEEVSRLKQQPGKDILISGSGDLVNTLVRHDLIDEYRLMPFPVVVASGKRLFRDGSDTKALKLVDTKSFGSGVVVLSYEPAGNGAEEQMEKGSE